MISLSSTSSPHQSKPSSSSPPVSQPSSPREPNAGRIKTSPQLNRCSRARAIRSGRKLDRHIRQLSAQFRNSDNSALGSIVIDDNTERTEFQASSPCKEDESNGRFVADVAAGGKAIYMVSDGTGWTAEHLVHAALGQFDYCLVDRVCPVNTHLFSGQAAKEGAMLVYTLADPSIAETARQACELWGVTCSDILSPVTEAIASHLGVSPSGLPRWAPGRKNSLSEEYFRTIEAIEFTIKQDDGALPQNLTKADIILTGVSRTGKTPLSIYLSQKGYKVANVPIVMNVELPRSLFEVDPEKVFALTINPVVLQTIRKARA